MNLFKERNFGPMLLSETEESFNSEDYIFEMKFDGHRALIFVSPTSFYIQSRNQKDITNKFPELKEIQKLVDKPTVLDGEIVLFENGVPNFSKLQTRAHVKNSKKINIKAMEEPVVFVCFDILYYGKDLTNMTLLKRKKILDNLQNNDIFTKTFFIEKKGIDLFKKIQKKELEGIVAKEKNSTYEITTRTDKWIKIKNIRMEDFYVGGYSENLNSNVFSLYLGEYKDNEFIYVGKVFTSKKNDLYEKLKKIKSKTNPFTNFDDTIHFVKPKYICEVEFLSRNKKGGFRHASFRGIKN